jgi:hypothetical protein
MVGDAAACSVVGLVDMHPSDRAASQSSVSALVLLGTANSVVEDEDTGSASARSKAQAVSGGQLIRWQMLYASFKSCSVSG